MICNITRFYQIFKTLLTLTMLYSCGWHAPQGPRDRPPLPFPPASAAAQSAAAARVWATSGPPQLQQRQGLTITAGPGSSASMGLWLQRYWALSPGRAHQPQTELPAGPDLSPPTIAGDSILHFLTHNIAYNIAHQSFQKILHNFFWNILHEIAHNIAQFCCVPCRSAV